MAPKHQSSLTSFFAAKGGSHKPKAPTPAKKSKENAGNKASGGKANNASSSSPNKKHASPSSEQDLQRKKRRVIDDDESDDEEITPTTVPSKEPSSDKEAPAAPKKEQEPSKEEEEEVKPKENDKPKENKTVKAETPSASTQPAKEPTAELSKAVKKDDDNDKKEAGTPKQQPRKKSEMLALAPKDTVPSDAEILKQIPETAWPAENEALPYLFLCQSLAEIEGTTKRLQIQSILTTLLRQVLLRHPTDLYPLIYLASNSVAPAYECVELGIGDSLLVKAIGEATGTNTNMVKTKYDEIGDLGSVAMSFKGKQKKIGGFFQTKGGGNKPKPKLTAKEVLTVFREIAQTKGNQAQKWKVDKIKKLLVKASDALETKYIIRGLQGKLRIGLAESTVLVALAHAVALTTPETVVKPDEKVKKGDLPEEAQQYLDKSLSYEKRMEGAVWIVKKAYNEVPSYDALLDAALKVPLEMLHKSCVLTPGIPVSPMLAKPTKSIQEVLKRLNGQKFTCEYKYDGERAQVHLLPDGTTKVFSRNLLDTSEKFPEVPLYVREAASEVESCVMDAEVVAFNRETGQLVPFQILSTRKKTEESAESAKVQVIVQSFDLMYLNGDRLLNTTLAHRRELLKKHFKPVKGKFQFAVSLDHKEDGDTTVIEEFLDQAVKGQCEGLMVKTLEENANYEPSRRSLNWLKLKKDYLEGLGDSVDLVPLGAYHGKGKRTGVYGAYLLACYDPDTEEFQSVCKIGTGFSDEDLKTLSEKLNENIIPTKSRQYNVSDQLACDVWFDSVQVWEVRAADLSKSSAHRGADGKLGEAGRGIGLRFPRFERVREDKRPHEATSCDQILEMYYRQDTVSGGAGYGDDDDDGI